MSRGRFLQDLREPFRNHEIHFLRGQFGDRAFRFLRRAAHRAFKDVNDEAVEQDFVADPERVEITSHPGVSGIPLVERAARDTSRRFCAGRRRL